MIASLMMYRREQTDAALMRFWALVREAFAEVGIESPNELSQDDDPFAVWTRSDLLLSQTCGMPYRERLHGQVSLVGTPDYGLDGCAAGHYRSLFIARKDDPRKDLTDFATGVFAYNERMSQSGFYAPTAHASALGFTFETTEQSGAHIASSRAVAEGRADIASLDAMTWELIKRYDTWANDLRVIAATKPTPGLPLITAQHDQADAMYQALGEVIKTMPAKDRDALCLRGIVKIPKAAYLAVGAI